MCFRQRLSLLQNPTVVAASGIGLEYDEDDDPRAHNSRIATGRLNDFIATMVSSEVDAAAVAAVVVLVVVIAATEVDTTSVGNLSTNIKSSLSRKMRGSQRELDPYSPIFNLNPNGKIISLLHH